MSHYSPAIRELAAHNEAVIERLHRIIPPKLPTTGIQASCPFWIDRPEPNRSFTDAVTHNHATAARLLPVR